MAVKKFFKTKKGMIFTMISLLLVGVLIAQLSLTTITTYKQKSFVTVSRVNTMNDFLESVEEDIERGLLIAGYRAIISVQKYIATNGSFVPSFEATFEELLMNGTINGVAEDLMANASITDWGGRINEEAAGLNINIGFTNRGVTVEHQTPWIVAIHLNITFNATDSNDIASWYYSKMFSKNISIVSFEDPLYTVKSYDRVTNIIAVANNTDFVDDATNDTAVLYIHLNNSYYVVSTDAPSFLMRFEGNLSNSSYGIESLVDLEDFSKQSLSTENKSVVDYQYFDDAYDESDDKCNFNGMPSWFRIHKDKRSDYELDNMGDDC